MKNIFILTAFISLFSNASYASLNYSDTIGFGGALGIVTMAPWASVGAKDTTKVGPRGGLWARYHHRSPNIGWEVAYDHLSFSDSKLEANAFTASLFWRYFVDTPFQPIWEFGFGLSKTRAFFTSGDRDMPIFKFRAGVDIDVMPQMTFGLYLDHFSILKNKRDEPQVHALSPVAALNYYFGGTSFNAPKVAEAAETAPVTATAKVQEPKAKPVSDLDADGDGVPDSKDKCPGSPIGAKVNEFGCAVKQSFEVKLDVKFKSGTAALESSAQDDVKDLADIMKKNPDLKVELQGHTDNIGPAAKNLALSKTRATAVKNSLVKNYKISPKRIQVKGFGGTQPVGSNTTEAGRALNRRVIAKVIR